MLDNNELFENLWIHARESDDENNIVFVPETTHLPPSRGRDKYEFFKDGRVIKYTPGPDDKPIAINGLWVVNKHSEVEVTFPNGIHQIIRSISKDFILIKKHITT